MKAGDIVYVQWPTGRGGPYEYIMDHDQWTAKVVVNGEFINVSKKLCEPVEPEIEEGRLVIGTYRNIVETSIVYGKLLGNTEDSYLVGSEDIYNMLVDEIRPMHRRWDELSEREQNIFTQLLSDWEDGEVSRQYVFRGTYNIISGEKHP